MANNILILHGWGSSSKNWSSVKKFLEEGGLKVYNPDLPGFGKSPAPKKPWAVDDYVSWVESYCKKTKLTKFFLMGHSFGGGIAVRFASLHPDKVERLILVDPAIVRVRTLKYYLGVTAAKAGNIVLSVPFFSWLKPLLRRVMYKLLGTRDYQKLDLESTASSMKETFKKVVEEDLSKYLPAVEARTLVVWGEDDNITPIRQGYFINAKLPNSRMEIIKEARHGINLEFPDVLSEKVLKFLKS